MHRVKAKFSHSMQERKSKAEETGINGEEREGGQRKG